MLELLDTGFRRSPADHRDWDYRDVVAHSVGNPLGVNALSAHRLPRRWHVDRRSPLTAEDQVGPSCVGWMMAMVKTVHERRDKRRTIHFDGQTFYNEIALPGGGAYLRDAFAHARRVGVPDLEGRRYTIAGYASVDPRNHSAVRHAIVHSRGVAIGFGVTLDWMANGGQEFDVAADASRHEVVGGHGMYIHGYEPEGPDGLNSWGPEWSDDGRQVLDWEYWDKHVWECWTVLDTDD